jgi:hypothetical protein
MGSGWFHNSRRPHCIYPNNCPLYPHRCSIVSRSRPRQNSSAFVADTASTIRTCRPLTASQRLSLLSCSPYLLTVSFILTPCLKKKVLLGCLKTYKNKQKVFFFFFLINLREILLRSEVDRDSQNRCNSIELLHPVDMVHCVMYWPMCTLSI